MIDNIKTKEEKKILFDSLMNKIMEMSLVFTYELYNL